MSGTALNDAERAAVAPLSARWVRVAFVSTTLVLLAVHLLWPTGPLGDATFLAAVGGAAVMAWMGVLRRPRGASRIPVLIAAGVTASALGDLIWYLYLWSGEQPSVSMADAAYLLAYVGLAAALVLGTLVGTGAGAAAGSARPSSTRSRSSSSAYSSSGISRSRASSPTPPSPASPGSSGRRTRSSTRFCWPWSRGC